MNLMVNIPWSEGSRDGTYHCDASLFDWVSRQAWDLVMASLEVYSWRTQMGAALLWSDGWCDNY